MASGLGTLSNFPGGFSGGLTVQGMPLWNMFATSAGPSNHSTSGVYWVNSNTGADGNPGTYMQPMATLARAIAVCSARDYIMLMPGHAETYTSSTAITLSVANVTIIGMGANAQRPTFTFTTANTATINVTAANVVIQNCIFVANFLSIAACFTLTNAPGFVVDGCQFQSTDATHNWAKLVLTDSTTGHANDLMIANSSWFDTGTTSAQSVIGMVGTNARVTVTGNYFATKAVTGAALMPISTTKVVTNLQCTGNTFNTVGATTLTDGVLITTDVGTNSGIIANNYVQGLDATGPILVTAASGFIFMENYYQSVADKSGLLTPANS